MEEQNLDIISVHNMQNVFDFGLLSENCLIVLWPLLFAFNGLREKKV